MPQISVIIPTRFRPELVRRAIGTVLTQSCIDYEIIVVVDGPDPETEAALKASADERLTVLTLPDNVGLAEARNVGVRAAKGTWVAFLDDDDEWLPEKLEHQLQAATRLGGEHIFVACGFLERTQAMERVMPLTLPHPARHFSEYIYCDGGYLQPSTFFCSRALLVEVPFTKGLRHIEDTDWLLRAMSHPAIRVMVLPKVLSIYNNLKGGGRESEVTPWGVPLAWAQTHYRLFTRKAFPFYIARLCLDARRARRPLRTFAHLFWIAFRHGEITPRFLSYFLAYCFLSEARLKRLRARVRPRARRELAPPVSLMAR